MSVSISRAQNLLKLLCRSRVLMQNTSKNLLATKNPQLSHNRTMADTNMESYKLKVVHLSLEDPVADYQRFMDKGMNINERVDDEILDENFKLIGAAARQTVWKLLFGQQTQLTEQQMEKAGDLLTEYKRSACFYDPYIYNDWIKKVRDELLRREMFDFWQNVMVKNELGPCWARDSDFFDDLKDPEPAEFYKFANCEAPFDTKTDFETPDLATLPTASCTREVGETPPAKISMETPATDYSLKITYQNTVDCDNDEAFRKIYKEAQEVLWKLLFSDDVLSQPNYDKAAALLEAYKQDACFILPHEYNEWIVKLRDELFARKRFNFWKDVIVQKQLGLCWYKDCDHFDDAEDTKPIEFYKSGDALMKNLK